jgi:glycosyltransferase involved in cell wall biosynthesis
MSGRLRVCVDARLESGSSGGVEQVIIGLASGLSSLTDGDEEYLFLCYEGHDDWLRPFMGDACRVLHTAGGRPGPTAPLRRHIPARATLRKLWRRLPAMPFTMPQTPRSDGTIEGNGIDVMHFAKQSAFLTDVPSIYHPHDLQHLHLPQFFSPRERQARERLYKTFCLRAAIVATSSAWTKQDVVSHYSLPEEKVRVVPLAPPVATYPEPTEGDLYQLKTKFGLGDAFIFYPAQTWEHKNHIGLLEALACLRDQTGLRVPLVCCGRRNSFYAAIEKRIHELGLQDLVTFLDYVEPAELRCLYELSRAVVIPTKFESASFPLWEAFLAGKPTACSNVTSLPEQAANAALLFDPNDTVAIAEAIDRVWRDDTLRSGLIERGRQRVRERTWERTARTFRAHYRRLSGGAMTDEDRALVAEQAAL